MVKTPSTRHSKSGREPVTIDHAEAEAKIAASPGSGKAYEGPPSGNTDRLPPEADKALRQPATQVGETHQAVDDLAVTPDAMERDALVDTHADSPIMHPELAPAQSSTEMLHADKHYDDKPEAPLDEQEGRDLPKDETAHNPYDEPDPEPARPQHAPETPVREPVVVQRSGGGTGRMLAAAVLGGLIALGGYGLLNALGLFGNRSSTEIASLQAEIAELRSGLQASEGPDLAAQIEDMRAQLAGLQQGGNASAEIAALAQRLDELGTQVATLGETAGGESVDLGPLTSRLDALDGRLSSLQQELVALTETVESGADDPRLARAVTASALKAAIDRGEGFQAELDAYAQASGGDSADVAALRDMAGEGVPTRATITQALPDAAAAMVAAAEPEPTNGGVIARLWSSASDLVEVRPVGADVQGSDAGAVVARLEAAVEAGDYGRALSEFELLPQASKSAGEAFIAKVRARHTADELVGKALSDALKG